MTAKCDLCKDTIIGRPQAEIHGIEPATERGKIVDYDALAAQMWLHISESHPDQMAEGIMTQRRAAKMYAMNWANIAPELETVRQQHRQQLLIAMTVTSRQTVQEVAEALPAASSDSESSGNGSNEKKSDKNVSN